VRIAVLFDNFGPYHYARLNAATSVIEVTGIEMVARSREYDWATKFEASFPRTTLCSETAGLKGSRNLSARLTDALNASRPDVVAIPGWSGAGAFAALDWCSRTGTPAILMSESTRHDQPRVSWREKIKRRVVNVYSTALVGGQRHVEYLIALGMPRERIFRGYDVVDNAYFAQGAKEVESRKAKVEKEYELPKNYFLASARFIKKKNLFRLLKAYSEYRKQTKVKSRKEKVEIWDLVLLGDGPLKSDLRHLISDLGLQNYVLLPGFKQYDELPAYYGLAQAFVHASTTEQWGLVVNEAMASGLPVIVSNRCGCVPELVHENVNGFTFDPYNEEDLTSRLLAMSSMRQEELAKFGKASSEIIAEHDVDRFAQGLKNAAELAISLPRKRSGVFDRALLLGLMRSPR
jgi:1,2-diacylglycerol 3-alpha-glucosyltransferase